MDYISYCGLKCNECPVFIAAQNSDKALKEQLAKEYSTSGCSFKKDDMVCAGCHAADGVNKKMCLECSIRICGMDKPISNCAECETYPCGLIEKYVPHGNSNRELLDKLAQSEI